MSETLTSQVNYEQTNRPVVFSDQITINERNDIFNEAYQNHYNYLFNYAKGKISTLQDVEEIVQNVFLKFFEVLSTNNTINNVQAYLFQILRNSIVDYYRGSSRKTSQLDDAWPSGNMSTEETVFQLLDQENLWKAISKLDDMSDKIIILDYIGYSYKEIAEIIFTEEYRENQEKATGVVKSRIHRIRRRLNSYLSAQSYSL